MIEIILIRHFPTKGNLFKRYIGTTDEPLCEKSLEYLDKYCYPKVEAVYASPMLRCIQTAGLIYPEQKPILYEDFRECDFGEFENKNYMELTGDLHYQAWIDNGGKDPFPKGERIEDFKARCILAFKEAVRDGLNSGYKTIVLVVHGGTIMSILEALGVPKKDYYHWQTENGGGYMGTYDEKKGRFQRLCIIPLRL